MKIPLEFREVKGGVEITIPNEFLGPMIGICALAMQSLKPDEGLKQLLDRGDECTDEDMARIRRNELSLIDGLVTGIGHFYIDRKEN